MSMLSPGGVGRSRPYRTPRRRRIDRFVSRVVRPFLVLLVLAGVAGGGWYFAVREPTPPPAQKVSCPTPAARPAVRLPPIKPQQITVNVYNATKRSGLAAATAAALRKRGFTIGKIANDPLHKTIAGPVELRSAAKGRSRVAVVAVHIAGARSIVDARTDLTVDLVLGQKFTALRTPAQVSALLTAPPKPAGC